MALAEHAGELIERTFLNSALGGIHASSRHQENFSRVWISHSGSWRKGADVDIISFGRIRTGDYAFVTRYRNSVRQISFCFFRRNSYSSQHSDRRRKLLFFN